MFHARDQKSPRKFYFFFSDSVMRLDELRRREITVPTTPTRTRTPTAIAINMPGLTGVCVAVAVAAKFVTGGGLITSGGGATFVGAASAVAGTAFVSGIE